MIRLHEELLREFQDFAVTAPTGTDLIPSLGAIQTALTAHPGDAGPGYPCLAALPNTY